MPVQNLVLFKVRIEHLLPTAQHGRENRKNVFLWSRQIWPRFQKIGNSPFCHVHALTVAGLASQAEVCGVCPEVSRDFRALCLVLRRFLRSARCRRALLFFDSDLSSSRRPSGDHGFSNAADRCRQRLAWRFVAIHAFGCSASRRMQSSSCSPHSSASPIARSTTS
jgi:hypothetical protein